MKVPSRLALVALISVLFANGAQAVLPNAALPPFANERVATVQVRVTPDRAGWTYQPGEQVSFHVAVVADQQPLVGATIEYEVGPEMLPGQKASAVMPAAGLTIPGGTLAQPGFIRCIVKTTIGGKAYRGVATAGFAPDKITPTQTEPADFDAFWNESLTKLAKIPVDARVELIPEASTGSINVYHVSFRTWTITEGPRESRMYGILCEPKAPGKYPAILRVPGAGVRPYSGQRALAEQGAITLEIGIHGIPVNQAPEIYEQLRSAALDGYSLFNLDDKERYYYRRVYLGCIRANDFLTSRESWDGKNLLVSGASQGGQLTLAITGLDKRVTAASAAVPAYCDVTGYLHNRAGGWPHMMRGDRSIHRTPEKIATTSYYDSVNFARRVRVPILVAFGYNDETCPPTSVFAMYNSITAPKELMLALEMGHSLIPEFNDRVNEWLLATAAANR